MRRPALREVDGAPRRVAVHARAGARTPTGARAAKACAPATGRAPMRLQHSAPVIGRGCWSLAVLASLSLFTVDQRQTPIVFQLGEVGGR